MSKQIETKRGRSKKPPGGWVRAHRPVSYKAPPRSRTRKILRVIFNAWTMSLGALLAVVCFLILTYYWMEFSDRIDRRLLSGEVFTSSAGIYSAPKTLRTGEAITPAELIEYLKSAGYIEKNNRADASRSRYSLSDGKMKIEPGKTGYIDGQKVFPTVTVNFSRDGKSVSAITEDPGGTEQKSVRLEPRVLSTIAAEGDGRRRTVSFDDLPPHLIKAITVTEDRAFFEHYGVNFRGIARALWRRYEGEDDSPIANQGGSSITQQLVKNLLLTNAPTLERKLTEAYMSVILETRLSKKEIFTLYANQIYLGQQSGVSIYGVGEAANAYFGKDVSQISLPEAAFIAGIIRSPNRYSPYKNQEKVTERRNQVLESMLEAGEISDRQYAEARNARLELKQVSNRKDLQGMPYFSQYVMEELPKLVSDPEALQHKRVYTSIDPDLQRIAYETVSRRLEALDKLFRKKPKGRLDAALVAMRPKTGEIVAMVGGRDYLENQFNRATSAMRQPGSVFKPFVYATAINSVYDMTSRLFTAATIFKDEKKTFASGRETYAPNNYGDHFSNQDITLRDALVKSKNTITVDLAMHLNVGKVMNLAAKAGLPRVEHPYPSMALGTAEATPLQVAAAYSAFANLGERALPLPITRITDGDGRTTTVPETDKRTVIRSDVAYILNDMMKDVINRGTAARAKEWGFRNVEGKTGIAGKTGTSRDGWFAGFTPELVCVVYVGFDDGEDLGLTGSESAMPIWADFVRDALSIHPEWNGDWTMPAGIRKAEIDIRDGSLIREIDGSDEPDAALTPTPTPTADAADDPAWMTDLIPDPEKQFVTNVPEEFRRIELFIAGTIPNRKLIEPNEDPAPPDPNSSPSPLPFPETWQRESERKNAPEKINRARPPAPSPR